MLCKSEALVLRKTDYAENSAVVSLFTHEHGSLSFLVNQLHGKNSKAALLQPGNLLEIVFYYNPAKNLHRIKELKRLEPSPDTTLPLIQQLVIFCTEITGKTISDSNEEYEVFLCIKKSLQSLHSGISMWFIPSFLLQLSAACGHGIDTSNTTSSLDLISGEWHLNSEGQQMLLQAEIAVCRQLQKGEIPIENGELRRNITAKLLLWFQAHLLHGRQIKSYDVLKEIYEF